MTLCQIQGFVKSSQLDAANPAAVDVVAFSRYSDRVRSTQTPRILATLGVTWNNDVIGDSAALTTQQKLPNSSGSPAASNRSPVWSPVWRDSVVRYVIDGIWTDNWTVSVEMGPNAVIRQTFTRAVEAQANLQRRDRIKMLHEAAKPACCNHPGHHHRLQ